MRRIKELLRTARKALRRHRATAWRIAAGVLLGIPLVVVLVDFVKAPPAWCGDECGTHLERLETAVKVPTAVVVLFGLFIAYKRSRAHERQAETAEQGQITERFTKAVEMLGNTKSLQIRLGGIYTLERIARETKDDELHKVVFEVLCAFVRDLRTPENGEEDLGPLPQDVQAVLSVIRRREEPVPDGEIIDLRWTDLRGAHLVEARLEGAILAQTCLNGAKLQRAHLEGADLYMAHFKHAELDNAHFEGAKIHGAHFKGAILFQTHFGGTHLLSTTGLTRCALRDAHGDEYTRLHKDDRPDHWPPEAGGG